MHFALQNGHTKKTYKRSSLICSKTQNISLHIQHTNMNIYNMGRTLRKQASDPTGCWISTRLGIYFSWCRRESCHLQATAEVVKRSKTQKVWNVYSTPMCRQNKATASWTRGQELLAGAHNGYPAGSPGTHQCKTGGLPQPLRKLRWMAWGEEMLAFQTAIEGWEQQRGNHKSSPWKSASQPKSLMSFPWGK